MLCFVLFSLCDDDNDDADAVTRWSVNMVGMGFICGLFDFTFMSVCFPLRMLLFHVSG